MLKIINYILIFILLTFLCVESTKTGNLF